MMSGKALPFRIGTQRFRGLPPVGRRSLPRVLGPGRKGKALPLTMAAEPRSQLAGQIILANFRYRLDIPPKIKPLALSRPVKQNNLKETER